MDFAPVENYFRRDARQDSSPPRGELEDAEQEFRTAIAGVPGPCIEIFALGYHLAIRMQKLDEAVPFLVEARPDRSAMVGAPRSISAMCIGSRGSSPNAIGEYGRAIACDPARTDSRDALLEIHLRVLDDPGLAPAWDGLVGEIEKIPGAGDEPRLLALVAVGTLRGSARRDLGRARESIERAETLSPDDPAILSVLAEVRLAEGRRGEAIRVLERAKPVPTGSTLEGDRLAAFRRAHLPDLASLASVDAALDAIEPGAEWGEGSPRGLPPPRGSKRRPPHPPLSRGPDSRALRALPGGGREVRADPREWPGSPCCAPSIRVSPRILDVHGRGACPRGRDRRVR